jgi:flagellar biosynthesis repressor protein FlbT
MKNTLKITLKPNEKIYVNGAVIRTDRKVALEFLNDVDFLLEGHVLQPEEATTPLRQLYFIVQVILMTPGDAEDARQAFRRALPMLLACFTDDRILSPLKHVDRLVSEGQVFEALKQLRGLYGIEAEILEGTPPVRQMPLAMAVGE